MKKEADSTGEMMHCERAVGGGRARVTTDEELVLPVDWTEMRYIACQVPAGPALHRKRKMLNLLYTFCTSPNHGSSVLRWATDPWPTWPIHILLTHLTHDPLTHWPIVCSAVSTAVWWWAGELDGDVSVRLDTGGAVRTIYVLHELQRTSAGARRSKR